MDEQSKQSVSHKDSQTNEDTLVLLRKIAAHLVILEKKMDNLNQTRQDRPFKDKHFSRSFNKPFSKPFSKPFRPFEHSGGARDRNRHDRDDRDDRNDRDRRNREGHPTREYSSKSGDFNEGRPFKKHDREDSRGFIPKKKPFFHKFKDRHKRGE